MVEPLAEPAKKRRRTSALEAIPQDGGSCPSTAQDIGPHNNDKVEIIKLITRAGQETSPRSILGKLLLGLINLKSVTSAQESTWSRCALQKSG